MIDVPTVFILGAGASIPYGYPSGEELRKNIILNLQDETKIKDIINLGHYEGDVHNFVTDLKGSQTYTIDEFIEHRKELIEIGKCAIAQALIKCEDENILLYEDSDSNWYRLLYRKLNSSFEDFDQNQVGMITFNYDRSLEEYLFNVLQRHHGKDKYECASKLKEIPIIHMFGKIGDLPWQNSYGRAYDMNLCSGEDLRTAARGIRTIHEDEDKTLYETRKLLDWAEEIYFLGFGYDTHNLKLLNIDSLKVRDGIGNFNINKTVRGTAFKLGSYRKNNVSNYFLRKIKLGESDEDCVKFLSKYGF